MSEVTLVTGSQEKAIEFARLLPAHFPYLIHTAEIDEIQSLDSREIITDKAHRAYDLVGSPVIVEDISAGIPAKGGLPGPFIKFHEKARGPYALLEEAGEGVEAIITSTVGYFDGNSMVVKSGAIVGHTVLPRGTNGYGYDFVFEPVNGGGKTYAEMTNQEKDAISERSIAVRALVKHITASR